MIKKEYKFLCIDTETTNAGEAHVLKFTRMSHYQIFQILTVGVVLYRRQRQRKRSWSPWDQFEDIESTSTSTVTPCDLDSDSVDSSTHTHGRSQDGAIDYLQFDTDAITSVYENVQPLHAPRPPPTDAEYERGGLAQPAIVRAEWSRELMKLINTASVVAGESGVSTDVSPSPAFDSDWSDTDTAQPRHTESVDHEPFYGHGRRNSALAAVSQAPRELTTEDDTARLAEFARVKNVPVEALASHAYINLTQFGAVDHLHGALAQTPESPGKARRPVEDTQKLRIKTS
eukprot:m.108018 g.108018  ORF g.108018 m.108018 type:complete len:287 (-) comp16941_c0_seq2:631-1491(-)